MTGDTNDAVLIESILNGAWGCLSKQDDGSEQLRLIRRALAGHTAYSRRFQPALVTLFPRQGADERLLSLSRQEMRAAICLTKGLSNRQISQEMSLAEKTIKNLVSSLLMKLGMARRTQAAVLVSRALHQSEDPAHSGSRFSLFPGLAAEVAAALLICTSDAGIVPPTDGMRAGDAVRLAGALVAVRTGQAGIPPAPRPA